MSDRKAKIKRQTRETRIDAELNLDGIGQSSISTGLGFIDHMLDAFAMHARIDLDMRCEGDLVVDDHHTIEDCAIALGEAMLAALADKRGIKRFASAFAPLDESLARVVIDISGRPYASVSLGLERDSIGAVACENITHFFQSFAIAARITMHIDVLRGENDHHRAEAAFKACAIALREAVSIDANNTGIPSTKGVL
jgi:imidazoleglycerol phosphate dehydratase HisB